MKHIFYQTFRDEKLVSEDKSGRDYRCASRRNQRGKAPSLWRLNFPPQNRFEDSHRAEAGME